MRGHQLPGRPVARECERIVGLVRKLVCRKRVGAEKLEDRSDLALRIAPKILEKADVNLVAEHAQVALDVCCIETGVDEERARIGVDPSVGLIELLCNDRVKWTGFQAELHVAPVVGVRPLGGAREAR